MSAPLDRFHLVGTLVADQYRVDEVLAESPLSLDYRGTDAQSGGAVRLTVLKVLGDFSMAERRAILNRLLVTTAAHAPLARLDPVISGALDAGALTLRDGNWVPFVAQSYFAGASLEQIRGEEMSFKLPPRTLAQAMQLFAPAARALGLAAARGIVHGGLTPGCIALLGDPRAADPQLRIFDWGLAQAIHEARAPSSGPVAVTPSILSPRFAAPEQLDAGGEPVSPATDVYAFALVMAYMLAYPPDDPQRARDPAFHRATPGRRGAALPAGADAVFARALSASPAARPPTVSDFWAELSSLRGRVATLSSIPPPPRKRPVDDLLVRLPAARPDDKTIQISSLAIPKPAKPRSRWPRIGRALALLLLIVAALLVAREFGLTSRISGLFSASP